MLKTEIQFSDYIQKTKYPKCVITGATVNINAVHIINKNECEKSKNTYLKFHKLNGITLRKDIQQSFDNYFWCFNPFDIKISKDNNLMDIGIIYDLAQSIPTELTAKKYVSIQQDNFLLLYVRFIEFSYKYANRHKKSLSADSYSYIKKTYEYIFGTIGSIQKLDEYAYNHENDVIMMDIINLVPYLV
jgi:hypothetical protein